MHPLLKIGLQLSVAFVIIFFLVQPYNWFCQLSNQCKPFYFSYYMPKREGKSELRLVFEILNYRENVNFFADKTELTTVPNRKNIINFTIKNLGKRFVIIRPKMTIEPAEIEKYIKSYQCLCSHTYKLKPGQEITVPMEFEISKEIERKKFDGDRQTRIDSSEKRILESKIKIRFRI